MTTPDILTDAALGLLAGAATSAGSGRALLQLAVTAKSQGKYDRAIALARQAEALAGHDNEISDWANELISAAIPRYHVSMIRDKLRNDAFEAAIARAVTPETRVLDVGSGTGLLAMMAARAGAREVFSCEVNPALADVAREIVERNGLADRVTILTRHSRQIDADADLGGRVDLVVAEVFGSDLVNEGVLPSMRDIARRLIAPGARMIPQSGEIRVALGWWEGLADRMLGQECGFDMTPFNRLVARKYRVKVGDRRLQLRGEEAALFSFDLGSVDEPGTRTQVDLIAHAGPINGIIQWIRLKMDDDGELTNRPGSEATSHWACQFFAFHEPIDGADCEVVRVSASHAGNELRIWRS